MPSNEGAGAALLDAVPTRVLIIGGSYAGLAATVSLLDVCAAKRCRFANDKQAEQIPRVAVPVEITIVDERDGYFHLIGSPLAFACEKYASKAWQRFEDIPAIKSPFVRFIQGSVENVDCGRKIAYIKSYGSLRELTERYDYLIVSSGLRRTWPTVPESLQRIDYLAETQKHITSAHDAEKGVVVIGGGAVGIEMAAELKTIKPSQNVTLIHSRSKLLSSEKLPDEFKDKALELLEHAGVKVVLGQRVASSIETCTDSERRNYELTLQDGSILHAGHIINAVSRFVPTSGFMPPSTTNEEGYIKISPSLSFSGIIPNAHKHFAAGDIAQWSGIKRCGAAMHQGHFSGINVYQSILRDRYGRQPTFFELEEVTPMMGLAVGKQAATYNNVEGVLAGEDRMKLYFGDDLGYSICWNYMRLGEAAVMKS